MEAEIRSALVSVFVEKETARTSIVIRRSERAAKQSKPGSILCSAPALLGTMTLQEEATPSSFF
jgi:hypothetical protein